MRHLSVIPICAAALMAVAACGTEPTAPPTVIAVALAPTSDGNGQFGVVGTQLSQPLRVLVTRNTIPLSGATVHWAASAGSGVVAPATATTDGNGFALAAWTMPTTIGSMSATATVNAAEGSPVAFSATARAGPATSFELRAGDNQILPVNTVTDEQLTVGMTDTYGNPVEGSTVFWSVFSGTATLSALSVETGPGGTAGVYVTAGAVAGPVVVRAIPVGALPEVDFHLTVTP